LEVWHEQTPECDDPILAPLPKGDPFSLDDAVNDAALPLGLKRPIFAVPIVRMEKPVDMRYLS